MTAAKTDLINSSKQLSFLSPTVLNYTKMRSLLTRNKSEYVIEVILQLCIGYVRQ